MSGISEMAPSGANTHSCKFIRSVVTRTMTRRSPVADGLAAWSQLRRCGVLLISAVGFLIGSADAADWGVVAARDNRGTVLIRTNWVDGKIQDGGTGTGFVVDDKGSIVTVAHQFPASRSAVVLYSGETEGWASDYARQSFPLELRHIDRLADVAVLVPTKTVKLSPIPLDWDWAPTEGRGIYVRGFPLGGGLEGMEGLVRRTEVSSQVPTSTLLRAGHSGSPVYNAKGQVVGMARGGTPVANVKEDPTLLGLGFFVPLSLLKDKLPATLVASIGAGTAIPAPRSRAPQLRLSYPVDETKETSFRGIQDLVKPSETRPYTTGRIQAQPGYRIDRYELIEHSATKVSDKVVKVAPDGSSVELTFKLTSGPGSDRWRGWLAATLVTIQIPKD